MVEFSIEFVLEDLKTILIEILTLTLGFPKKMKAVKIKLFERTLESFLLF